MSALRSGEALSRRFTLIRRLGRGGAAEVWLVRDHELDDDVVAKIVPPGASEDLVTLLRRECRNVRRLQHPNIVPLFDLHTAAGAHLITMPRVEGVSIGRYRRRPPAEIVNVVLPLVDALAYAHDRGVVHRDLKPSNILCDAAGQPRLLDFGIAALLEGPAGDTRLRGGGTAAYASPQQLRGDPPEAGDDIYALGVVLYELLCGRPPFWPDAGVERVRDESPAPLPPGPELPAGLRELVARMLAKSPVEPQLTPPPRAEPIRAIPATAEPFVTGPGRPPGSRPWWILATVLGCVAVLVAVFLILPGLAERIDAGRTKASQAAVTTTPTRPGEPTPEVAPGTPSSSPEMEQRAQQALGRADALLDGLTAAAVESWGGEEYRRAVRWIEEADEHLVADRFESAAESYERAADLLETVAARGDDVLADAVERGTHALDRGEAAAAVAAFETALAIAPDGVAAAQGLRRARVLDEVVALLRQGAAQEESGDLEGAAEIYRRALELDPLSTPARQALDRLDVRRADLAYAERMTEGLNALERGDPENAAAAFREARRVRPGGAEAAEGLARAERMHKLGTIAALRDDAAELERAERWAAARERYAAVLELDPALAFARDGKERCRGRAGLAAGMIFHLDHPERLSADAVFAEASDLLAEARQASPAGPVHRDQVRRLEALLDTMSRRIRVQLESDNLTEVTIHRVGRLGTFFTHELELRPGTYTVVGSRRGYRDVRRQLVVEPDAGPESIVVRCEEKI
jgi:tetratricopeptide (TPR) repeat protein